MKSIEFKKRRGIIVDMFSMLCLYTKSSSLDTIYKHYKIKIDQDICNSYATIYQFIDDNMKDLKPFFAKSPHVPVEGGVFHKLTRTLIVQEHVFIEDLISFLRKMKCDMFVAEIFRLTDARPEAERCKYLNIVHNRTKIAEFLERQNYTVREKRAIKRFIGEGEYSYGRFINFIERLYALIEREHKKNDEKLSKYSNWIQTKLYRDAEGFILDGTPAFNYLKSSIDDTFLIVTVGMFPPYSMQTLNNGNIVLACFGYGAYTEYARKSTIESNRIKTGNSHMRNAILQLLKIKPMRLCDLAESLTTSSADISYHIRVLENNGYIRRIRLNGYEHFTLRENPAEQPV